jgi:hypothetical protein
MSITSRARNPKQPTHNSSNRPRLFGECPKPLPFDITEWQRRAHEANESGKKRRRGAFGKFSHTDILKSKKARQASRAAAAKAAKIEAQHQATTATVKRGFIAKLTTIFQRKRSNHGRGE